MHELGIVSHVIRAVEETAAEHGLRRVSSVTLELGQVSGVVPEYLVSCWRWSVARLEGELLRDSVLLWEEIPAVTLCNACGENYETVKYARRCPRCGSEDTVLLRGNEINIRELAVPDGE